VRSADGISRHSSRIKAEIQERAYKERLKNVLFIFILIVLLRNFKK
jgi:hypothetical protein